VDDCHKHFVAVGVSRFYGVSETVIYINCSDVNIGEVFHWATRSQSCHVLWSHGLKPAILISTYSVSNKSWFKYLLLLVFSVCPQLKC